MFTDSLSALLESPYAQTVSTVAGGRAFARGSVFTRAGALVASVAQEGISRRRDS